MANRKSILAVALVFAAGAVLTACDEVVAKPGNYTDAIVLDKNGNGLDIVNNDMQHVYDQIRNGALASDVLNEFLYQYAVSAFGAYNHVLASAETYTLKDAAKEILASTTGNDLTTINVANLKSTKANDFVKEHKAYWTVDDDNNRIHYDANGAATTVSETEDADILEYARVYAKWDAIEKKIAHTLYSAISNGTYSERNVFHEKDYVWSLYGNMKDVANPTAATIDATCYKGLIWPEVEDYEVFTKTVQDINGNDDTLLHRENYQVKYGLNDEESASNAITYVEDDLIPDIYRTLLVEQYLLDESYPTLGRSYARKVNIIKVTGSSTYTKGASYLLDAFLDEVIFNANGDAADLDDLKLLSNAWTGAFMAESNYATSDEYKLWEKAGLVGASGEYEKTAKDSTKYIAGTAYGDMMEKYDKVSDNPNLSENSSEFTGSNAYNKEVGKEIATRELATRDNTTTGWFIKNGGLTELPDSIRNRLFNISVANAVNLDSERSAAAERRQADGTYDATKDYNNYVAQINGKHYLKVGSKVNDADPKDDILFVDGDNYYIIQIEEAVSSSKLSRTQTESYLKQEGYGASKMEEIVNEVVKIVADSDSYRSLSKKFWLEKAELKYHDTVIYNYFKANFPELFED